MLMFRMTHKNEPMVNCYAIQNDKNLQLKFDDNKPSDFLQIPENSNKISIGRNPKNSIVINDIAMSNTHVTINQAYRKMNQWETTNFSYLKSFLDGHSKRAAFAKTKNRILSRVAEFLEGDYTTVTDLGTTNGTFLEVGYRKVPFQLLPKQKFQFKIVNAGANVNNFNMILEEQQQLDSSTNQTINQTDCLQNEPYNEELYDIEVETILHEKNGFLVCKKNNNEILELPDNEKMIVDNTHQTDEDIKIDDSFDCQKYLKDFFDYYQEKHAEFFFNDLQFNLQNYLQKFAQTQCKNLMIVVFKTIITQPQRQEPQYTVLVKVKDLKWEYSYGPIYLVLMGSIVYFQKTSNFDDLRLHFSISKNSLGKQNKNSLI